MRSKRFGLQPRRTRHVSELARENSDSILESDRSLRRTKRARKQTSYGGPACVRTQIVELRAEFARCIFVGKHLRTRSAPFHLQCNVESGRRSFVRRVAGSSGLGEAAKPFCRTQARACRRVMRTFCDLCASSFGLPQTEPIDQLNEEIAIIEEQIGRILAHKERMRARCKRISCLSCCVHAHCCSSQCLTPC